MKFDALNLSQSLLAYLQEQGIDNATPVQSKVIPKLLQKKSLLVVAQTGTGKTLSYALPIVQQLKELEQDQGRYEEIGAPQAVILAPTKELAQQIHGVFKEIAHHAKFRVRMAIGGMTAHQVNALSRQSFDVLVATPSKMVQALKKMSFDNLKFLVLDESDTLFEMGFQKDVEGVIRHVEYDQTNISFFSATLPMTVELFLSEKFKKKELEKVTLDGSHRVQSQIETFNLFVSEKEKLAVTQAFLQKSAAGRGIIFANQKNQVDAISAYLKEKMPTLKMIAIHGDQESDERLKNIKKFSQGKAQILVASDVVARGIDVADLQWVFNYNLPRNAEFYLHRCGRVGRMNNKGMVYNLITDRDAKLIALINESIKGQSSLNLDFIAKSIKEVRKRPAAASQKKVKQKRVKITKRTKLDRPAPRNKRKS